jgi:hypothetical protein
VSLITRKQVQIVQIARRQVEKISRGVFDSTAYQIALCNCGVRADHSGRCSSKNLTQAGFEKLMAIFESMGYREPGGDPEHWRKRNSARTGLATTRQVREIRRLAPRQKYPVSAICQRVSNNTHSEPEQLTMAQAAKLIEGLKSIIGRNAGDAGTEVSDGHDVDGGSGSGRTDHAAQSEQRRLSPAVAGHDDGSGGGVDVVTAHDVHRSSGGDRAA